MGTKPAIELKVCSKIREQLEKVREAQANDDDEADKMLSDLIFADLVGKVSEQACTKYGLLEGCCWYQVLAAWLAQPENRIQAELMFMAMRKVWGSPSIGPSYALLLHRYLLSDEKHRSSDTGGRIKILKLLFGAAQQVFWGDVEGARQAFRPMFQFLCDEVVLSADARVLHELWALDAASGSGRGMTRRDLLTVVAQFVPYYCTPVALPGVLERFPSPAHTLENGGHRPGEANEFVLSLVVGTLRKLRTEGALLAYLRGLQGMQHYRYLHEVGQITQLRLQAELYNLTKGGGPRYLPRSVNQAAFKTLDSLFPLAKRSRKWIELLTKLLHPSEWRFAATDAWHYWLDGVWALMRTAWQLLPLTLRRRWHRHRKAA